MSSPLRLVPAAFDDVHAYDDLRLQVRAFLAEQIDAGLIEPSIDSWVTGWDEQFTRALAARGWVGMTVPRDYGGPGRSHLERFVVTEELLAAGAPVAAHWIADRQIVPSLLTSGTEHQRRTYLPRIVTGSCYFGIGMSEPDSGSDLASVQTRATRVAGGWSISGTKVWTSGAHYAEAFICLARTSPVDISNRHAGLSQFIVDLGSHGVEVRPIVSMNGRHHFNEVLLDDVLVSDDMVFGNIGEGWKQVTSELGFERSGSERFLSTFPLLTEAAQLMSSGAMPRHDDLGRFLARIAGLRQMSTVVAGGLERGQPADTAAAVVKVLGTTTEGDIAEWLDLIVEARSTRSAHIQHALMQRPGFTLRGGTNEVLRGIIARGLGMR